MNRINLGGWDDSYKRLERELESLPKEYRKVWKYYQAYLLTPEEIASKIGVPIDIVNRIIESSKILVRLY